MALKDMGLVPLIIDIDDDIIKPLFAKEGDYRSRGIELQILNKGKEIDTSGVIVEFYAKPKDRKVYVVEATPVDTTKGKYEIIYPSSILQPGVVQCEIRLVKMTDDEIEEIITTKTFNLKVYKTIADEDIFEGIDIEPIVEILAQAAINEKERIQAENERIQAENERIQAENTRQSNENIRNSNEQTRQQNEAIRQQNEQQRIDLYNTLKDLDVSQYELRLQNVENQVNIDNFLLEEWDEPVIPLPSNATNGQINDIKIEGKTYRNVLEDYISDSNNWERLNGVLIDNDFIKATADATYKGFWLKAGIITLKPSTQYTIFVEVRKNTLTGDGLGVTSQYQDDSFGVTNRISPGETGIFKFLVTTKSDLTNTLPLRMYITNAATSGEVEFRVMLLEGDYTNENISYIRGTKSTFGAIRLKSVNEDETKESTLYVIAKDEVTEKIYHLKSVPNISDKIIIKNGEARLIKNISNEIIFNGKSSEAWGFSGVSENGYARFYLSLANYPAYFRQQNLLNFRAKIDNHNFENVGQVGFATNLDNGNKISLRHSDNFVVVSINSTLLSEVSINGFKAFLSSNPLTLTYQLAQPIEMPVEVFGNLQSYENGTVYIDTIVSKVNFYDGQEGITVTVPIKAIDTLYKVDKETGYLHPLDISQAVIAEDGLSFTHPELADGDLVDWDYIPDVESTNPAISMKLPTNLKASITSTLQGVQELSNKTKKLDTRIIANRRDIYNLQDNFATLQSDVFEISNELDTHKAEYAKEATQFTIESDDIYERVNCNYYKKNGFVFLVLGSIQKKDGSEFAIGEYIATLPVGFRPKQTLYVQGMAQTGSIRNPISLIVYSSGEVQMGQTSSDTIIRLSVSYYAGGGTV